MDKAVDDWMDNSANLKKSWKDMRTKKFNKCKTMMKRKLKSIKHARDLKDYTHKTKSLWMDFCNKRFTKKLLQIIFKKCKKKKTGDDTDSEYDVSSDEPLHTPSTPNQSPKALKEAHHRKRSIPTESKLNDSEAENEGNF